MTKRENKTRKIKMKNKKLVSIIIIIAVLLAIVLIVNRKQILPSPCEVSEPEYYYDASGNLIKIDYGEPCNYGIKSANYFYDANFNLVRERTILGVNGARKYYETNYIYDADGNFLRTEHVPSTNSAIYEYDEEGRIISAIEGDETYTYTYDSNGSIICINCDDENKDKPILYYYDDRGEIFRINSPFGVYEQEIDENGILIKKTNELGSATYNYDENGSLVSITDAGFFGQSYTLNECGTFDNFEYDELCNLISDDDYNYTYDENYTLVSQTDLESGVEAHYFYDYEFRLSRVEFNDGSYQEYNYDTGGLYTFIDSSVIRESCGDGVVSGYEECDGNIEATCEDFGFESGSLFCTDCAFDTFACVEKPLCRTTTCEELKLTCGIWGDSCGNNITCGWCSKGNYCDNGRCLPITPATCSPNDCGIIKDGAGGVLDCGDCDVACEDDYDCPIIVLNSFCKDGDVCSYRVVCQNPGTADSKCVSQTICHTCPGNSIFCPNDIFTIPVPGEPQIMPAVIGGGCTDEICIPDCLEKSCGDDGCGGSCGSCEEGICSSEGTCAVDLTGNSCSQAYDCDHYDTSDWACRDGECLACSSVFIPDADKCVGSIIPYYDDNYDTNFALGGANICPVGYACAQKTCRQYHPEDCGALTDQYCVQGYCTNTGDARVKSDFCPNLIESIQISVDGNIGWTCPSAANVLASPEVLASPDENKEEFNIFEFLKNSIFNQDEEKSTKSEKQILASPPEVEIFYLSPFDYDSLLTEEELLLGLAECSGDCGEISTPYSCYDGIQNGFETGIDCGLSCMKDCPVACLQDEDCEGYESCVEGFCEYDISCINDSDCLIDEICEEGICVYNPITCINDSDCDIGETCIEGVCTSQCIPDNDICLNKGCGTHLNGTCGSVICGSCESGFGCSYEGICIEEQICVPACVAGETCIEGVCVPEGVYHPADTNQDGHISTSELIAYIDVWLNGEATTSQLIETIDLWLQG